MYAHEARGCFRIIVLVLCPLGEAYPAEVRHPVVDSPPDFVDFCVEKIDEVRGVLTDYKVTARLNEYYIDRIQSGQWVMLVDKSGYRARRVPIRLGRQNAEHYEVLDGLRAGDRIIVSGYDRFGDAQIVEW